MPEIEVHWRGKEEHKQTLSLTHTIYLVPLCYVLVIVSMLKVHRKKIKRKEILLQNYALEITGRCVN